MGSPHVIRLSRAWDYRPAGSAEDGTTRRIDLPWPGAAELSGSAAGLELSRHFNGPPNLDPAQRVLLVVQPAELAEHVSLNDTPLTESRSDGECAWFNVAQLLQRHNRLHVLAAPAALANAAVRLVIEELES